MACLFLELVAKGVAMCLQNFISGDVIRFESIELSPLFSRDNNKGNSGYRLHRSSIAEFLEYNLIDYTKFDQNGECTRSRLLFI